MQTFNYGACDHSIHVNIFDCDNLLEKYVL